jgi:hypothetical protein
MSRNQFLVNLHHLVDRQRLKQIVRLLLFSVYVPFEILVSLLSYV